MSKIKFGAFVIMMLLTLSASAQAQQIYGSYVETRSADVYTGPCFANGEVGLTGDQAILAWKVQKGSWNGVALDGLSVVAVAKASATLGDPHNNPYPAKAILIVDQKATAEQREALVSFARGMGGNLLADSARIETAPIDMEVDHHEGHPAAAYLKAGALAGVQTRPIGDNDHLCGNESTYYPPLVSLAHAMPAVAVLDQYLGTGLGVSWTLSGKRSAFVGSFAR